MGHDTMSNVIKVSALERHPAYPKALGILSAEIGVLEMLLGELLGAVLGVAPHVGQIIYNSPQSYTGRLDILSNVISAVLRPEAAVTKRLIQFIKRTRARIQYRNTAMHSLWGIKKSDPSIVTRRDVPLLEGRAAVEVPITEIENQITKLRILIDEVESEIPSVIAQRRQFFLSRNKSRKRGRAARPGTKDRASRRTLLR
jgi:hypothetical protein